MATNIPRYCEQTEAGKRSLFEPQPLLEQLTRRPHRSPPATVPNSLARLFPPHMTDGGGFIAPPLPHPTAAVAALGRHAVMQGAVPQSLATGRSPVNAMQFVAEAGVLDGDLSSVERHLLMGGGRGDDSLLSTLFEHASLKPQTNRPHFARHPRMNENTATKNLIRLLLGNDDLSGDSEYVPTQETNASAVDVGVIGGEQRGRSNTIGKMSNSKGPVPSHDGSTTGSRAIPSLIKAIGAKLSKDGDDDSVASVMTRSSPLPFPGGWHMSPLRGGGVLLRRDVDGHADLRVTYPRESLMALSRSKMTAICPDEWAERQANLVELLPEFVHRFEPYAHDMLGAQISITHKLSGSSHRHYFDCKDL